MLNYRKLKSKRPKKAKTLRSRLIAMADTLFSKIVRMRDRHCQWPGCRATTIYNHHIFSRRYLNTRWDLDNGISLCIYHHSTKAHGGDAEEFRDMILRRMGEAAFLRLKARACMRAAPVTAKDVSLILIGLRARLKEMQKNGDERDCSAGDAETNGVDGDSPGDRGAEEKSGSDLF